MNFGPPLVTAGGLVFHAGTTERKLRAHEEAQAAGASEREALNAVVDLLIRETLEGL